jgi:hypothetical protein
MYSIQSKIRIKIILIFFKNKLFNMFKKNLFTLLTSLLLILLPFYVLIAVFFSVKIWIPKAGFYIKELVIVLLIISLIYEFIKNKIIPKLEIIDYLIIWYIWYWIIITLINWLWLNSLAYGWRYDFILFIVFLIYKHWKQFLEVSTNKLVKLFLISSSISLLFSILIKFRLWEQSLLSFWYVNYVNNWTYNWNVPIYHWLENSWIKRFQWIFDWPNQMAFFLILYTSIFIKYIKQKIEYHIALVLIVLFLLLIMTYSRSALLWFFLGIWLLFLLNLKHIYKNYKKQLIWTIWVFIILSWTLLFLYSDKVENIFLRTSSTTWHFDRMEIWFKRFLSKPMWAWLAEAGPAYRNIYPDKQTKAAEQYYIPESWFIQQLIEWWYIYFGLFIAILTSILIRLYKNSKPLFVWFIAILVMNVFLHIFEATYLSVLLFIFVWLFYSNLSNNKKLA